MRVDIPVYVPIVLAERDREIIFTCSYAFMLVASTAKAWPVLTGELDTDCRHERKRDLSAAVVVFLDLSRWLDD